MGETEYYTATCRFCKAKKPVQKRVVDRCVERIQTVPVDCDRCGRVTFYRGTEEEHLVE